MKKIKLLIVFLVSFLITTPNDYLAAMAAGCVKINSEKIYFIQEYDGEVNNYPNFKLYSLNKEESFDIYINDINRYYLQLQMHPENVYNWINEKQKQFLQSSILIDDFIAYEESGNYTIDPTNKETFLESLNTSNGIVILDASQTKGTILFLTFGFIEQTSNIPGYEKEQAIVPIIVELKYDAKVADMIKYTIRPLGFENYRSNDSCKSTNMNAFMLKYSPTIDYTNLYEAINTMDDDYIIENNCNINFTLGNVFEYGDNELNDYPKNGSCTFVLRGKKGTPNIQLDGKINNEVNLEIEEETPVEYKLVVSNNSNVSSSQNIIKSKLPARVKYVLNSASNNGVYDEETHTVSWEIDNIDANDEITLTYKVIVPSEETTTYEFLTSFSSEELENVPNVSNKVSTKVINNPNTGDYKEMIILIVLIISCVIYYKLYTSKNMVSIEL